MLIIDGNCIIINWNASVLLSNPSIASARMIGLQSSLAKDDQEIKYHSQSGMLASALRHFVEDALKLSLE